MPRALRSSQSGSRSGSREGSVPVPLSASQAASDSMDGGDDDGSSQISPHKLTAGYRTQIRKSCQFCRRRKIKCVIEDGQERCNACLKRPMQDCRFAERGAPDDPPPPKPWERNPRTIIAPLSGATAIRVAPRTGSSHRYDPLSRSASDLPSHYTSSASAGPGPASAGAYGGSYGFESQDMYRRASENTAYGPYSQFNQQQSLRSSLGRMGSLTYPGVTYQNRSYSYDYLPQPSRPGAAISRHSYSPYPAIDFNGSQGSARLSYGGPHEPTSSASTTYVPTFTHRPSSAHALLGLSTSSSAMSYEPTGQAQQASSSVPAVQAEADGASDPASTPVQSHTAVYRDEAGIEHHLPVVDARPGASHLRHSYSAESTPRYEGHQHGQQHQYQQHSLPAPSAAYDSRAYPYHSPYYYHPSARQHYYQHPQEQYGRSHTYPSAAAESAQAQSQAMQPQDSGYGQQQHGTASAPATPQRAPGVGHTDSGFVSENGSYFPHGQPTIWPGAGASAAYAANAAATYARPSTPRGALPPPPGAFRSGGTEVVREDAYHTGATLAGQVSQNGHGHGPSTPRQPINPGSPASPYTRTPRSN